MYKPEFVYDYTSISASGARWIVENTDWQLIGLDYLSVTTWDDNTIGHQLMLGKVNPTQSCLTEAATAVYSLDNISSTTPCGVLGALKFCLTIAGLTALLLHACRRRMWHCTAKALPQPLT